MRAALVGEARYGLELGRLLADGRFRAPDRAAGRPPVLLIPGFLAGDASLTLLAGWLGRRGHRVVPSGIRVNAGCAGRELRRLERLASGLTEPTVVIGQSRGGTLARALAAGRPESVTGLVTLGSPVLDPLAVSPPVRRTVQAVADLGDRGLPGVFTTECADGDCCADYRRQLTAPLRVGMPTLAVHSRSDGIVDWRACLDRHAECVEIDGSHCGMAVNRDVYGALAALLDRCQEATCSR
jgi:pimeloyl-ACP methyl ester carboxylesterase